MPQRVVVVSMEDDGTGNKVPIVNPDTVRLSIAGGDFVRWVCGDGVANIEILFTPGQTPFGAGDWDIPAPGAGESGVPIAIVPEEDDGFNEYKYVVKITSAEGALFTVDPKVRVHTRIKHTPSG
ncbi:MAG TPA: hypothetical protein VFD58_10235 [Blastocatellia bacterium]|nr:hypothetical protein [Blastocatellia bacterium]